MENKLYGKRIVWDGDSICAGKAFDDTKESDAWAGRIAEKNLMIYKNYAKGGGTVTENVTYSDGVKLRHSVSATLDRMYEENLEADYIILEGGTNDADLLGTVIRGEAERFGVLDPHDFSGEYDRDTFSGALESVFYRATRLWKGKKIAYIVAHKMGAKNAIGYTADVNNRRAYFERAIAICEKWGIPYLDLWKDCYLNPKLSWMYDREKTPEENVSAGSFYADGQHLTAKGYDLTADIIDSWLKTL